MKTIILSFFLILSLFSVAQKNTSFISIGPSLGIPPDFRGQWGSGASIRGYIGTSKQGSVLINSSVIFYPSNYEGRTRTVSMLKAGYKMQLLHPCFFLYGDAGIAIKYGSIFNNGTDPEAGIGLGYSVHVGEHKYIDLVPGWNFRLRNNPAPWIRNSSILELHIAYRFGLK